ncbi:MAG: hypothetical protein M3209_10115 [Acidobacteriota bacterium]|nr:hypothetical protein [Acidobacteriota bacterium]
MVEIHPEPAKALSDGLQALAPYQFLELVRQVRMIHKLISKKEIAFVAP